MRWQKATEVFLKIVWRTSNSWGKHGGKRPVTDWETSTENIRPLKIAWFFQFDPQFKKNISRSYSSFHIIPINKLKMTPILNLPYIISSRYFQMKTITGISFKENITTVLQYSRKIKTRGWVFIWITHHHLLLYHHLSLNRNQS